MLALLLIMIGIFAAVCFCARRSFSARNCDCIIVLGAHIHPDGSMCRMLRYRCERALRAWRDGVAPVIIVCGGQCTNDPDAEAHFMRDYFIAQGVPQDRILCEDRSLSTYANFEFAGELMARNGLRTAAVVTSDYHLTRALWIAESMKMKVCGIPAASSGELTHMLKARLRETVSWMKYFWYRLRRK